MPLYLVRWPLMRVSLVRAENEDHLLDLIDEVASPTECTWTEYDGPVWVDFAVPGVCHEEKHGGPLELDEVSIDNPEAAFQPLAPLAPDAESFHEMENEILSSAFPNLAKIVDRLRADDNEPGSTLDPADLDALRAAVAKDEVRHDARRRRRGITFNEGAHLRDTRELCFQMSRGRFCKVDIADVERFFYGRHRLAPDRDGLVRLAYVSVARGADGLSTGRIAFALHLRANAEGEITTPHRADAFAPEGQDFGEGPGYHGNAAFMARRNEEVRWNLSASERQQLEAAIAQEMPGVVLATDP